MARALPYDTSPDSKTQEFPVSQFNPQGLTRQLLCLLVRGSHSARRLAKRALPHSQVAVLASAALLSAALAAPAQAEPLSIDEAVARSVADHPALEAATHRAEAAQATAEQAATAWLPRLTVDAKYRFSGPIPTLEIDTGITPPGGAPLTLSRELGSYHFAALGATAAWRVYDFGTRDLRTQAAETVAEAAGLEREVQAADIAYAVRASYLALAFSREVESVTALSLKTAQDDLDERETRLRIGVGTEIEVAAARSRLAELQARQVDVAQDQRIAESKLRTLLNLDPDDPIELSDSLQDLAARARTTAPETTPALERLSLLEDATQLNAQAIERAFWPTLDAFVAGDFRYPQTFVANEAGFTYAAGVSLSWLVFDGGLADHQVDEAAAKTAELASSRTALSDDLKRQSDDALTQWEAASERIQPAQTQLETAEAYLKAAKGAQGAGVSTALDVARAEERLEAAGLARSRAYFEQAMAQATWLHAQGLTEVP
ncbi:MAG: hypothetical protein AUK47_24175 [Deltaproteobacteria bacterium CG2_30_63_29]|nr:MAG: hypothetical protein AUK47_24175 [Deltaproteobacteria bacterium CG2_30_63_29]